MKNISTKFSSLRSDEEEDEKDSILESLAFNGDRSVKTKKGFFFHLYNSKHNSSSNGGEVDNNNNNHLTKMLSLSLKTFLNLRVTHLLCGMNNNNNNNNNFCRKEKKTVSWEGKRRKKGFYLKRIIWRFRMTKQPEMNFFQFLIDSIILENVEFFGYEHVKAMENPIMAYCAALNSRNFKIKRLEKNYLYGKIIKSKLFERITMNFIEEQMKCWEKKHKFLQHFMYLNNVGNRTKDIFENIIMKWISKKIGYNQHQIEFSSIVQNLMWGLKMIFLDFKKDRIEKKMQEVRNVIFSFQKKRVIHGAVKYFKEFGYEKMVSMLQEYHERGMVSIHYHNQFATYCSKDVIDWEMEHFPELKFIRSLVLDITRKKIACYGFENIESLPDVSSDLFQKMKGLYGEVTEKFDGSLVVVFRYNGELLGTTKTRMDADPVQWSISFLHSRCNTEGIKEGFAYCFEALYKDNKHVVEYDFEGLVLLSIFEVKSGEELSMTEVLKNARMIGSEVKVPRVFFQRFGTTVRELEREEKESNYFYLQNGNKKEVVSEGDVIKMQNGERYKLVCNVFKRKREKLFGLSPMLIHRMKVQEIDYVIRLEDSYGEIMYSSVWRDDYQLISKFYNREFETVIKVFKDSLIFGKENIFDKFYYFEKTRKNILKVERLKIRKFLNCTIEKLESYVRLEHKVRKKEKEIKDNCLREYLFNEVKNIVNRVEKRVDKQFNSSNSKIQSSDAFLKNLLKQGDDNLSFFIKKMEKYYELKCQEIDNEETYYFLRLNYLMNTKFNIKCGDYLEKIVLMITEPTRNVLQGLKLTNHLKNVVKPKWRSEIILMDEFKKLHFDVLFGNILTFLPIKDLMNYMLVSRNFKFSLEKSLEIQKIIKKEKLKNNEIYY